MHNIKIIGTSHISAQSIAEIKKEIKDWKPDIVAIELDRKRLHALLHEQKRGFSIKLLRRIGVKGMMFMLVASFIQKKLGNMVGVQPGSDMKTAFLLAKKSQAKVALIDQDIEKTLSNFSKNLGWKERMRFVWDLVRGVFRQDKDLKDIGKIDLGKVPPKELIQKVMKILENRYPGVYKALVADRNVVMANNLIAINGQHPDQKILAVVGAGHEEDINKLLKTGYSLTYGN